MASIREPLSHQQPAYLQMTGRTRSRSSPRSEPRVLVGRYSAGGCFKRPPSHTPKRGVTNSYPRSNYWLHSPPGETGDGRDAVGSRDFDRHMHCSTRVDIVQPRHPLRRKSMVQRQGCSDQLGLQRPNKCVTETRSPEAQDNLRGPTTEGGGGSY